MVSEKLEARARLSDVSGRAAPSEVILRARVRAVVPADAAVGTMEDDLACAVAAILRAAGAEVLSIQIGASADPRWVSGGGPSDRWTSL